MKIADGVYMLEIFSNMMGMQSTVYPALFYNDGILTGPNPRYTFDMDEALKSLEKLKEYDIENIICYHGGLYNTKGLMPEIKLL